MRDVHYLEALLLGLLGRPLSLDARVALMEVVSAGASTWNELEARRTVTLKVPVAERLDEALTRLYEVMEEEDVLPYPLQSVSA